MILWSYNFVYECKLIFSSVYTVKLQSFITLNVLNSSNIHKINKKKLIPP